MNLLLRYIVLALVLTVLASPAQAQGKKKKPAPNPSEEEYYKILRFEVPPGQVLEAGAIEIMPDGKVAVGTRRGEIWMIDNAYDPDPKKVKFRAMPTVYTKSLGCAEGRLALRRPPARRDAHQGHHRRGKANLFEVVTEGWEINGDYHEYAFGSRFDKDGNLWLLCV